METTVKKYLLLLIGGLALLLATGCGKPPVEKINQSEQAMEAAQTAEAEEYAAEAYFEAKQVFESAEAAKTEQDSKFGLLRGYGKVGELYDSATVLAGLAETAAKAEKDRVKTEVIATMAEFETMLAAVTDAVEKAPQGKGSKADIELMKADLEGVKTGFAAAKADFEAGRYNAAKVRYEALANNVQKLMGEIESAKLKTRK